MRRAREDSPDGPSTFDVPSRSRYKSIGGYGVIGNTRTVALVGYDGSIDWCCLPKFDSPSVFAALIDASKGGRWTIQPEDRCSSTQRYLQETNILATEFKSPEFQVSLVDFMPCSVTMDAWSTPPEIHRLVTCASGEATVRFTFKPVLEYGAVVPEFRRERAGVSIRNEKQEMVLSWSAPLEISPKGVDDVFRMKQGDKATFVLSYGEAEPRRIEEYHSERARAKTEVFWLDWVAQLKYRGRWRQQVIRSALALKLLVYSPTGAIVAAPTTSLPENIGGNRNWDYRYSWIRDSANSLWAFNILGYRSEALAYLHWLIDNNPSLDLDLRLMYDVSGNANIREKVLRHLEGYRKTGPVRVGNAAVDQLQLDAYGYMLDALYFSHSHGAAVSNEMFYRFVKPLAGYIMEHWTEPGNGIWEIRNRREHYVYTKAWCWAGLDRAAKIARATGHREEATSWNQAKRKIRAEVMRRGWSPTRSSFVMRYGGKELDASELMLPLIGFIDVNERRMMSTIEGIQKDLGSGALLKRYTARDGLRGEEGAFILCSFWLVACLAKLQRVEEAERNFEDLLGCANHLGLLSEEVDMKTREPLGNFPQAFSHMGLILAASELDKVSGPGQA